MPNTLAHIAVQALLTRAVVARADPKWLLLGAVVPDVPWILQRLVTLGPSAPDPYSLRLYFVAQASLFGCLMLSLAFASVARRPARAYAILTLGSLLHLLLDALETKWANGVHLFAPFDWQLVNFGLFWPESPFVALLTASGLIYLGITFKESVTAPTGFGRVSARRAGVFVASTSLYFLVPVVWMDEVERSNSHFVATLAASDRTGSPIAIDRERFQPNPQGNTIETFAGEHLTVVGVPLASPARLSIKGRFDSHTTIRVADFHEHHGWARDVASIIGLCAIAVVWGCSGLNQWFRTRAGQRNEQP